MSLREKHIKKCLSNNCLGCGLCVLSQKHTLVVQDGFFIPATADIDSNWKKFCPGIRLVQSPIKKKDELLFGPLVEAPCVGRAVSEGICRRASSGGMITALLLFLLQKHLVDGIWQIGEDYDCPGKSKAFFNTTAEEVMRCMGSRYAPSILFQNFQEILDSGKKIAVVGKPCDIAGLKQFLKIYPQYQNQIVYTFSFMCMGLPSLNAVQKMYHILNPHHKQISRSSFRGDGWPGQAKLWDADGAEIGSLSYIESWGAILGRDTRFRCKICPDGFGGAADLSFGDGWYCDKGEPVFENESSGRSLVFVRSNRGRDLLHLAHNEKVILLDQYNLAEIYDIQKSQITRKMNLPLRYFLYKILISPKVVFSGFHMYSIFNMSTMKSKIKDVRGFLGRYWRDYLKKKRK